MGFSWDKKEQTVLAQFDLKGFFLLFIIMAMQLLFFMNKDITDDSGEEVLEITGIFYCI